MSDILVSVASKVAEHLVKPVKDQLCYLFCFKSIAVSLITENNKLSSLQEKVQHQVDDAVGNGKEIERGVREWLKDACAVKLDVEMLESKIQCKKTRCGVGCLNLGCQYNLSREAAEKSSLVASLQERGKFDQVWFQSTPSWVEVFSSDAFRRFSTTEIAFTRAMEALRDNESQMIGIYGMGGVGKTTLVKEVAHIAIKSNIFGHVFMVVVSMETDVRKIQGQMADMLGIELREESELGRARRIREKLNSECEKQKRENEKEKEKSKIKEKEILIILDDIWGKLDLQAIGIDFRSDQSCKILLTTRRQHVCTSMGCQKKIRLNVLSEKEAWDLFQENSGADAALVGVAMEVARECKGLPIALVTVGRALRDKRLDEWKMALKRLQNSRLDEIEDVERSVYECLELSYGYLTNEETKFCFLLCSLFPEDHIINVDDLTVYFLGLGLCRDAGSTEEVEMRVRVMVNSLRASCLLLDAGIKNHVVMHDVVRDVALWIASKGQHKFMVKSGSVVHKWPVIENSENCTAISLIGHSISEFSDKAVCPKLQILLLHGIRSPMRFSDAFFEEFTALKVLDIGYTPENKGKVFSLPKSLQFLTALESLSIKNCCLQEISVIGKLQKLKAMYFCGCDIYEFPAETFDLLENLTLLKMSSCSLGWISVNVAVRLVLQLEELQIDGRIWRRWEAEGKTGLIRVGVGVSDRDLLSCLYLGSFNLANDSSLCPLSYVTSSFCSGPRNFTITPHTSYSFLPVFYGAHCIHSDGPVEAFENIHSLTFKFSQEMNCFTAHVFDNLVELHLYLSELQSLSALCRGPSPKAFLGKLKKLQVNLCNKMRCVLPALLLRSLLDLENLSLHGCSQVEHVFGAEEEGIDMAGQNVQVLSSLKTLELEGLQELRRIWEGPSRRINLQNLAHVQVRYCESLVSLLSPVIAGSLVNLEVLELFSCEKLEQIVMDDDGADDEIVSGSNVVVLPRLWNLSLQFLPSLVRLCPDSVSLKCPSLQDLTVTECGITATCSVADLKTTLQNSVS